MGKNITSNSKKKDKWTSNLRKSYYIALIIFKMMFRIRTKYYL